MLRGDWREGRRGVSEGRAEAEARVHGGDAWLRCRRGASRSSRASRDPELSIRFLEQLGTQVPGGLEGEAVQTLGFSTKPGSASGGLTIGTDPSAPAQSMEGGTGDVSPSLLNCLYLSSLDQLSPSPHPGGSRWDSARTTHRLAGMGIPSPAQPAPQNGAAWSEGNWDHGTKDTELMGQRKRGIMEKEKLGTQGKGC